MAYSRYVYFGLMAAVAAGGLYIGLVFGADAYTSYLIDQKIQEYQRSNPYAAANSGEVKALYLTDSTDLNYLCKFGERFVLPPRNIGERDVVKEPEFIDAKIAATTAKAISCDTGVEVPFTASYSSLLYTESGYDERFVFFTPFYLKDGYHVIMFYKDDFLLDNIPWNDDKASDERKAPVKAFYGIEHPDLDPERHLAILKQAFGSQTNPLPYVAIIRTKMDLSKAVPWSDVGSINHGQPRGLNYTGAHIFGTVSIKESDGSLVDAPEGTKVSLVDSDNYSPVWPSTVFTNDGQFVLPPVVELNWAPRHETYGISPQKHTLKVVLPSGEEFLYDVSVSEQDMGKIYVWKLGADRALGMWFTTLMYKVDIVLE